MKIDQIKKLIETLSKESLLIWGHHLYDLSNTYVWVPEIKWKKHPGWTGIVLVNPEEKECFDLLHGGRKAIIDELMEHACRVYAEKVFGGNGKSIPNWCLVCLRDHISPKNIGKYTKRFSEDTALYMFVLPERKEI